MVEDDKSKKVLFLTLQVGQSSFLHDCCARASIPQVVCEAGKNFLVRVCYHECVRAIVCVCEREGERERVSKKEREGESVSL